MIVEENRDSVPSNIIYGIHAVEEVLDNREKEIDKVFFDSAQKKGKLFDLLKRCRKQRIPYNCIPSSKLSHISGTTKHQGVAVVCAVKEYEEIDVFLEELEESIDNKLILLPAGIEDSRNLGALIRSAVAFGVTGILLEKKRTSPLNGVVAKTSAGMIEHARLFKPSNLEAVVKKIRSLGFTVIGADGSGSKNPCEVDFSEPTLLIMGGEGSGIPPYLQKLCDDLTRIPMVEQAESLNVSAAASILLYEWGRQKGFSLK